MDYNTLALLLLIILIIFIPYLIFKKEKINSEGTAGKLFNAYAERLEVNCDIVDIWRDTYGIGFDSKKKTLIYVNVVSNVQSCIGLEDCKEVYLHQSEQTNTNFGKNKVKIEFVYLKIIPDSIHEEAYNIELYNHNLHGLDGELQLGQKWKKIIATHIG
ncbi:hypothetical protein [Mongoliibacter ruber]|uniref:Uncharacterized protein n=1 Tax=Mongoliibacter ruber TaxID=1750599 RepID=A0A2T0WFP2_9BACT|nr:hypothetical protein [Mongoliibacter ruber]PRY85492.1 hypothetical protein CLW00_11273 [Mongoliibacter ruber]